jgi:outer membrane protein OmpA-like peptidoglycan-associated protein
VTQFHQIKIYFMKRVFLFVLSCIGLTTLYSQEVVKERYTVSGGLLGAANFSQFRIPEGNGNTVNYGFRPGFAAGAYLNFPVGSGFSVEPQVLYSSQGYRIKNTSATSPLLIDDGKMKFLSVPLLLKFHAGDAIAITAGPQMDFLVSVEDKSASAAQESDFNQATFSVFGGLEVFPRGRVTIFGRYVHGLSSQDERTGETPTGIVYKNQNIQAGLKFRLFGGKKTESTYQATTVVAPLDSDGDGITDDVDKCPNQAGIAKYQGCPIPDTDNDGINDELDKCPNEAGTAKYDGCPIPDSDKDGINDEEDKCPNQAGIAKYQGCPVPDRDNDGVNDEEDKCPDTPGTAKNNGCPEIPAEVSKLFSTSASTVSFSTNSSKVSGTANASLNQIVKALNDNADIKVKLEGHSDNAEKNAQEVSEARAAAVKAYLISKGISEDRITVEGFGSETPISDNGTAAGRTKNRRVEIKVVN